MSADADDVSSDPEQGVPQAAFSTGEDVYIIYSFEDVAFRWQAATRSVHQRFRGTGTEREVPFSNRLFFDAQMGGRLATRDEYDAW